MKEFKLNPSLPQDFRVIFPNSYSPPLGELGVIFMRFITASPSLVPDLQVHLILIQDFFCLERLETTSQRSFVKA